MTDPDRKPGTSVRAVSPGGFKHTLVTKLKVILNPNHDVPRHPEHASKIQAKGNDVNVEVQDFFLPFR